MRADQIIALQDIQADVCDVFIKECDTKTWPSLDTKEGRGDCVWLKRNASASLKIVAQIEIVLAHRAARTQAGAGGPQSGEEETADALIRRVSKKADELLEKAAGGRKR